MTRIASGSILKNLAAAETERPESSIVRRVHLRAVTMREIDHVHLADVVTMACVLAVLIAEADYEQIERRGAFAPTPRQVQLTLRGAGLLLARAGRRFGSGFALG